MRMSRQSPGDSITFPYTGFLQLPNISGGVIEGATAGEGRRGRRKRMRQKRKSGEGNSSWTEDSFGI